ncbi:hypothetical protein CIRMBP1310_01238 [Enterococcus cecorum]|uniref:hypothetical protein n=1 Tax=Enterococcus cecorum TaxID=44008 RepID=UPI000A8877EA|nr:hypothetical protein [Enterococcus cecorum]MDZ5560913.1 hypothetical protein [Enterococcus cecorum]RBR36033.1 hypothetical protein EB26_00855 [Enterococcus cecorum]CAI3286106.1 hypothetical protein CIRMBP1204_00408 [Enterococcus cecorum]CAI3430245.1 hypothetical protein CIRMBP1310_01238 [Enterococcus cecorum]CAI3494846.1 hypothetical protein CIRMBP1311_01958 [Enterococcus cecorum]
MATKKKEQSSVLYSKSEILQATDAFTRIERDFLSVYLSDGEVYSITDARAVLNKKLKEAIK